MVHNLRKDYEVVTDEIQSFEGMDLQPLGNETIIWPRENILCYPLFVTTPHDDCRVSVHEGPAEANTSLEQGKESLEGMCKHLLIDGSCEQPADGSNVSSEVVSSEQENSSLKDPPASDTTDETHLDPPSTHQNPSYVDLTQQNPPSVDLTQQNPPSVDVTHSYTPPVSVLMDDCESVQGVLPLLPDLPQSREGLVELKAQLSMELLWLKQAIYSRQNVCTMYVVVSYAQK